MKDKTKKYDLSYFIKDGGRRASDTSPAVNSSEMNEEEMKRRNNNLNRELREMENPEEENVRNNRLLLNREPNNTPPSEDRGNDSNNNNNANLGQTVAQPKSEEQINAEIAASENRLEQLMHQFSLESHRNRPEFDTTLANINSPGAPAMDSAFERNNKRREKLESAKVKKERAARRLEKTGEAEGFEANKEARNRGKRDKLFTNTRKKNTASSAPEPTKEEIADEFFELVATSDRASDLTRNQLQQFSQNPIDYVVWARDTLLTGSQRKNLRRSDISPEELLTRLPRSLQELFAQIRSESSALNALQRLRLEKAPELSVLGSEPEPEKRKNLKLLRLKPVNAPNIPAEEEKASEAQQSLKVNVEPISVKPIMVSPRGDQLPPNHQESFNADKTKIKSEDKEKTKPSSIKIKKTKMSPENIQKKINNEAKKLSNQARLLDELNTEKILRYREEFIKKIQNKLQENKFNNWNQKESILNSLSFMKDETNKKIIKALMSELEQAIKEKELEKNIINDETQVENSNFKGRFKKLSVEELEKKLEESSNAKQRELISSIIKNLKNKNWIDKTKKLASTKGILQLKRPSLQELQEKINAAPEEEQNKIQNLSSMIAKLKEERRIKRLRESTIPELIAKLDESQNEKEKEIISSIIRNLEIKEQEKLNKAKKLQENLNQQRTNEAHEEEIQRIIQARQNKKEREEIKRQLEEEEQEKRSKDPEEILKKLEKERNTITSELTGLKKEIEDLTEEIGVWTVGAKRFHKRNISVQMSLKEKEAKKEENEKKVMQLQKNQTKILKEIEKLKIDTKKEKERKRKEEKEKERRLKESTKPIEISEKNSRLIGEILETQHQIHEADTEEKKSELKLKKAQLFKQIESNKTGNSHRYLKQVRETISNEFKKLSREDLDKKYAILFTKSKEMYESNNKDKKQELKKEVDDLLMKLYTDRDYNKKNRKRLMNKYKNLVNSKQIEQESKKIAENIKKNIENKKKAIQEKYNKVSEEKNLFKRYLKNSLSLVDEKNKAELEKLYKKLNTEEIKIFPKTKKKYQELINKYKKIEEMKVKKLNRTTNELATPNIKQVQKFKPKPEISPWAKKSTKNSSKVVTKSAKKKIQTFPKDSGIIEKGKSYKNSVKSTKQPVQNRSSKKDKSDSKKPLTHSEIKNIKSIKKLIEKLPSQTIQNKDKNIKLIKKLIIKLPSQTIQNREIQKRLRSLLDQKLISINKK